MIRDYDKAELYFLNYSIVKATVTRNL